MSPHLVMTNSCISPLLYLYYDNFTSKIHYDIVIFKYKYGNNAKIKGVGVGEWTK